MEGFPFVSRFLKIFIMKLLNFKTFLVSADEDHVIFFSLVVNMLDYIHWYLNVFTLSIIFLGVNHTWLWYIIFYVYCWIQFDDICWKFFTYVHEGYWSIIFFSVLFFSGVMLTHKWIGNYLSWVIWEKLCRFGVTLSLNVG